MGHVTDQHHAAKNRIRLINFHDLRGVPLPGLIKQLGDRLAEVVKVATPIAGRPTVSRCDVGIAVNRAFPQWNREQAASRCQSGVPGIVLAVPAIGNEAPAPATGGPRLGAAQSGGAYYGMHAIGANQYVVVLDGSVTEPYCSITQMSRDRASQTYRNIGSGSAQDLVQRAVTDCRASA